MLGARVIAVAVGYCFGLFQTGYIYGEKHGVDIRTQGSGNAGTTNTLRVLGWKAGLITFLGDLFKAIFAVLLIRFIFIGNRAAVRQKQTSLECSEWYYSDMRTG